MTARSNRNFVFLLAAVLVGESVISQPLTGNVGNDISGSLCGLVFAALLAVLIGRWHRRQKLSGQANETLRAFVLFAVAAFSFFSFSVCLCRFSDYAGSVMLNISSVLLPLISLALLAAFTVRKGSSVILKLGYVLFFLSAVFIIMMFIGSVPFIEVKYLGLYKAPTLSGFLYSFALVGGNALLAALPLLFLAKNQKTGSVLWGFALGSGAILLCLINTLGVFGSEFANSLSFPYSSAVSTASVGKIFSRMDPFLYCTCFFTCLLKCSVCLSAAISAVKKLPCRILFRKK